MSVSRCHAFLHWELLNVYLEDCNSKFGTLKLPPVPQRVELGRKLTVQCGKTVCQFTSERAWHLLSCFGTACRKSKKKERVEHSAPEAAASLPSKHALLVVRKKPYQKMMQREERRKRDMKLMEEVRQLETRSRYLRSKTGDDVMELSEDTKNKSFNNYDSKDETKTLATVAVRGRHHRRATANLNENIQALNGDKAGDPDFADCVL